MLNISNSCRIANNRPISIPLAFLESLGWEDSVQQVSAFYTLYWRIDERTCQFYVNVPTTIIHRFENRLYHRNCERKLYQNLNLYVPTLDSRSVTDRFTLHMTCTFCGISLTCHAAALCSKQSTAQQSNLSIAVLRYTITWILLMDTGWMYMMQMGPLLVI